jgi:hypothetical protein
MQMDNYIRRADYLSLLGENLNAMNINVEIV